MSGATKQWVLLGLLLSNAGLAETRRVPRDCPNIQAAIDASADGDVVLVAPGIYRGDGNRDIDFKDKAITVKSEAGPRTCIIDCQGSPRENHRGFFPFSGRDTPFVLDGFSIINGYMSSSGGGGIYCNGYSPHIKNCIVTGNRASGHGAGINLSYCSRARVENCLVCGNYAHSKFEGRGGGVYCIGDSPVFSNCTIVANRTEYIEGGGMECEGFRTGTVVLNNCILAGNIVRGTSGVGTQLIASPALDMTGSNTLNVEIQNSCIGEDPKAIYVLAWPDRSQPPSASVIRADPLFADLGHWDPNGTPDDPNNDFWVEGDYHLKSQAGRWDPNNQTWVKDDVTSPCIDAGDANSPIGYEPFPNGGRINMGVYGGTAEASKSYFGEPVCETIIAGDINGDCKVDLTDLIILIQHWQSTGDGSSLE